MNNAIESWVNLHGNILRRVIHPERRSTLIETYPGFEQWPTLRGLLLERFGDGGKEERILLGLGHKKVCTDGEPDDKELSTESKDR